MTPPPLPPNGEILLYQTEHARARIECRFPNETLWLSQALLAVLFQVTVPTVNEHLKNIFEERELEPQPTIRNFRIVRREGKRGRDHLLCGTKVSFYKIHFHQYWTGVCWERVELGIHGLKSWGRNLSRKVRETGSSHSQNRCERGQ